MSQIAYLVYCEKTAIGIKYTNENKLTIGGMPSDELEMINIMETYFGVVPRNRKKHSGRVRFSTTLNSNLFYLRLRKLELNYPIEKVTSLGRIIR